MKEAHVLVITRHAVKLCMYLQMPAMNFCEDMKENVTAS
jgi:hypothetical protein